MKGLELVGVCLPSAAADITHSPPLSHSHLSPDDHHSAFIPTHPPTYPQAFAELDIYADNLNIHPAVVGRAKEEFSRFRDVRESLQQYEGVLAACLALAYQELSGSSDLDLKVGVGVACE